MALEEVDGGAVGKVWGGWDGGFGREYVPGRNGKWAVEILRAGCTLRSCAHVV